MTEYKDWYDESEYVEDIYGDEIKVGDEYFVNEYKELIHRKNLLNYLIENCDYEERER